MIALFRALGDEGNVSEMGAKASKKFKTAFQQSVVASGLAARIIETTLFWQRGTEACRQWLDVQTKDGFSQLTEGDVPDSVAELLFGNSLVEKILMTFPLENGYCWFLHRIMVHNLCCC